MFTENTAVLNHDALGNGYHLLKLKSQKIAPAVRPGQFVHLRVPDLGEAVLRRPFSVFRTDADTLTILYREVGVGTRRMRHLRVGDQVNLVGPLGRGFPSIAPGKFPVLVAGGYGLAALYMTAARAPAPGLLCVGGATDRDILCLDDFEQLNWETRVATEDGSMGEKGLVTDILAHWLDTEAANHTPEIYACGPIGMLRAVSNLTGKLGYQTWVSMDRNMGCGLGACLACVQKVRKREADGTETWQWARICSEGPVFDARDIIWTETSDHA
ncbi:MAG: dihydroorotate dehydrogenase electron transfer subunit [Kiritimatiellia bacterium]|jgi:dihydroorotate dehydrogenase electron transfer subunit